MNKRLLAPLLLVATGSSVNTAEATTTIKEEERVEQIQEELRSTCLSIKTTPDIGNFPDTRLKVSAEKRMTVPSSLPDEAAAIYKDIMRNIENRFEGTTYQSSLSLSGTLYRAGKTFQLRRKEGRSTLSILDNHGELELCIYDPHYFNLIDPEFEYQKHFKNPSTYRNQTLTKVAETMRDSLQSQHAAELTLLESRPVYFFFEIEVVLTEDKDTLYRNELEYINKLLTEIKDDIDR